jgi:hypothetical protein
VQSHGALPGTDPSLAGKKDEEDRERDRHKQVGVWVDPPPEKADAVAPVTAVGDDVDAIGTSRCYTRTTHTHGSPNTQTHTYTKIHVYVHMFTHRNT